MSACRLTFGTTCLFLTVDQGVPHQQNLVELKIAVLVIRSPTDQMEDLLPLVGAILAAIGEVQPGEFAVVS